MLMRLPTFFILGAAKSGTTSLHHYLTLHPEIFMSRPKEPTFFSHPFQVVRNPLAYAHLFAAVGDEVHVGESSHAYLSHPEAPAVIRAFFPDAKFVLLLRDPVTRAWSLYEHMRRHGFERARTFEQALALEPRRLASPRFARRCPQYFHNYMYVGSGRYDEQLARYFDLYPRDRFCIHTFEQFSADPRGVLRAVQDFLGVEPRELDATTVHNSNSGRPIAPVLGRNIRRVTHRIGPRAHRVDEFLRKPRRASSPLADATRARLRDELAPSVGRLRDLLGWDPGWR